MTLFPLLAPEWPPFASIAAPSHSTHQDEELCQICARSEPLVQSYELTKFTLFFFIFLMKNRHLAP